MTTVFFDLDNTLTDRSKTVSAYAGVFLQDFKHLLAEHMDVQAFGLLLNELDAGGYGGHENRSRALMELPIWKQPVPCAELIEHWQGWIPFNSMPMDGLYECLDELKNAGYAMALVTNGSRKSQRAKIRRLELTRYFDVCLVSEEVGVAKPQPAIFHQAIAAMNCVPEQSVFVGDHPVNDYRGSQACGMTPVWFEGSHDWPHIESAEYSVTKLSELPDVIQQILRSN
ncbi:HAD family hydrolase [Reinekea marinisedimentorum]|uniref:Putative hydrolase of the HAD superfamily n=1 Tax=Reinekea marinisedimentorum TaxID=230495 RepID=A0A4R3I6K1_9GAMM|nr:HAD family hydrolase [Reinekea marinisedimentorum]TCS40700.1 putative hydrolase of the HAD superfamily [Reinekea marinisedimentorum]